MECSVEDTHLRNIRKNCAHSLDTKDVCRVVKRRKYRALLELSNYSVSDELAAYELLCTVNYAVTDSLDILECCKHAVFLVKESVDNCLDTDCVVCDRHFLHEFLLSCSLMLKASYFHSDSLNETFCEKVINLVILHIKKLILQ